MDSVGTRRLSMPRRFLLSVPPITGASGAALSVDATRSRPVIVGCCTLACGMDGLKMVLMNLPTNPITFLLHGANAFEFLDDEVDTFECTEGAVCGGIFILDCPQEVRQAEPLPEIGTEFFGDIRDVSLHVVLHVVISFT
jgi:hypothetical protein